MRTNGVFMYMLCCCLIFVSFDHIKNRYDTSIIVSQAVIDSASGGVRTRYLCRPLDFVAVKGRTNGTMIYEIVTRIKDASGSDIAIVAAQELAMKRYFGRDFDGAEKAFDEVGVLLRAAQEEPEPVPVPVEMAPVVVEVGAGPAASLGEGEQEPAAGPAPARRMMKRTMSVTYLYISFDHITEYFTNLMLYF